MGVGQKKGKWIYGLGHITQPTLDLRIRNKKTCWKFMGFQFRWNLPDGKKQDWFFYSLFFINYWFGREKNIGGLHQIKGFPLSIVLSRDLHLTKGFFFFFSPYQLCSRKEAASSENTKAFKTGPKEEGEECKRKEETAFSLEFRVSKSLGFTCTII